MLEPPAPSGRIESTERHGAGRSHAVREAAVLGGLGGALVATFGISLAVGSTRVPFADVVGVLTGSGVIDSGSAVVVESIRLPRSLTAVLAGAALGIAGLQMQTLFRNPLADPFALGISSGASLGVALVVLGSNMSVAGAFGASTGLAGDALLIAAAIAGALAVLTVVLAVSTRVSNPASVLILGLMFGYTASAVVTVLVGMSSPERLMQLAQWGFGSFSGVTSQRLWLFAPMIIAGVVLAACMTKQLNALLLGEHYARSMGVAVERARTLTMLGASILGAVVTAFCGPIAFLGIAVPHLCRGLLGTSNHRVLIPAVVMLGGIVALAAQVVSLMPANAGVLPLNAVTALIGAPVVVAILVRRRRGALAS
jgi:iron complex transport system permease protein